MEKKLLINPFENSVVTEPRYIEKAAADLNMSVLNELIARFDSLTSDSSDCNENKNPGIQLVLAEDNGCGKSHLIGMLFKKLHKKANFIYLRPFQNPDTYWRTILLKIIQQLDFPYTIGKEFCDKDEPAQLESFAYGVLKYLMIESIKMSQVSATEKDESIKILEGADVAGFKKEQKHLNYLLKNKEELTKLFKTRIADQGADIHACPETWIGVLSSYICFPSEFKFRQSCIEWLYGEPIDSGEAKLIGIKSDDITPFEADNRMINKLCKNRILDLCVIAGLFRPFIFCFDRTEAYGEDMTVAKAFESVIDVLNDYGKNHMTIVTVNQHTWFGKIVPVLERKHMGWFAPPLELSGISMEQGITLIRQRLCGWNFEDELFKGFCDKKWVEKLFSDNDKISIRTFLGECSKHWQEERKLSMKPVTIDHHYNAHVIKLLSCPNRLMFDPDTLYWLFSKATKNMADVNVVKHKTTRGFFVLLLKTKDKSIYIGFDKSSSKKRWHTIYNDAKMYRARNKKATIMMLRTSELGMIPGTGWGKTGREIKSAQNRYFRIVLLKKYEIVNLYAMYELYMDSIDKRIEFDPDSVIKFIQNHLQDFFKIVRKEIFDKKEETEPTEVPPELIEEIRKILSQARIMSLENLMEEISMPVSKAIMFATLAYIPEISIHTGPNTTIWKWD